MRRTLLLITILLTPILCRGQQGQRSAFSAGESVFDFGTILEKDGVVSHGFVVSNRSGARAFISDVRTSCGCTVPEYSRETVPPGGTTTVTVAFNPKDYKGPVEKTVRIVDGRGGSLPLTIRCNVIRAPRPMNVDLPIRLSNGLRIKQERFHFGQIPEGGTMVREIEVGNDTPLPVRISAISLKDGGAFRFRVPSHIGPGQRDTIRVICRLDPENRHRGYLEEVLVLDASGRRSGPVAISVIGVDAPSEDPDGPALRLSSQYENLGKLKGEPAMHTFSLRNTGKKPLRIYDIHTPDCIEASTRGDITIPPGGSMDLTLAFFPARYRGKARVFQTVYLTCNEPGHPVREIMIAAQMPKDEN